MILSDPSVMDGQRTQLQRIPKTETSRTVNILRGKKDNVKNCLSFSSPVLK